MQELNNKWILFDNIYSLNQPVKIHRCILVSLGFQLSFIGAVFLTIFLSLGKQSHRIHVFNRSPTSQTFEDEF